MARGRPDFSPTAVDVVLRPEWAAKEGTDKNFFALALSKGAGEFVVVNYTPATGKTLYICGLSFGIWADAAANYDHFLYGEAAITIGGAQVYVIGGLGGGSIPFSKPIVIEELVEVVGWCFNRSNVTCTLSISYWGYEV